MRLATKRRVEWPWSQLDHEGTEHHVRLGGEWVGVMELGAGDPIVLVPGLAGGARLLMPLARLLARRHRVFITGLRGDDARLGASGVVDLSDHANDLVFLLDQLCLERPVVLGVSFGGAIALEFAVEHPQRLGALVVQGAEARFRMTLGATIARRVLERFPLPSDNAFLNQYFNLLHGCKPVPGPLTDFIVERCWETDQSIIARRIGMLESFDVSDRLWRLDAPALVLGGTRDVVVPASRQRALAQAIPGANFEVLEGAGHVGFLTHRAQVTRSVGRLVREARHSPC